MPLAMIRPLVKASTGERRTWHVPKEASRVPCKGIAAIDTKVSGIIGTRGRFRKTPSGADCAWRCPLLTRRDGGVMMGLYNGARTAITVSLRS
jgi:hypothetical protein